MLLIDRKDELAWMEKAYKSKKAEFGIIYGRRRLGKTFLVKNFIENKKHFYFLAKQENLELEFIRFKEKFAKQFNVFIDAKNWEELFEKIALIASKEKLVIVIDEFPYWVLKQETILSEFQYLWDEVLQNKNVMLILLGSYVSVMEQKVLGHQSPLYGRRTFQINLQPMPVTALKEFFPKWSAETLIKTYGITDTLPYYITFFDDAADFDENLKNSFIQSGPIYQDAEILLSSELREYNTYLNILKSILDGATKLNEISNQSKVSITNISKYLKVLVDMRLIRKIKPATASSKEKNYLYELEDNYFRFWLTYILPYKEEIEESLDAHVKFVKHDYDRYLGRIFEKFCIKIIRDLPLGLTNAGRWWHKDQEIDIVALNDKKILFAECKWKDQINAEAIIRMLKDKSKNVKTNCKTKLYAVFAKSFSKKINEFEDEKVYCYDLKDIEKILA